MRQISVTLADRTYLVTIGRFTEEEMLLILRCLVELNGNPCPRGILSKLTALDDRRLRRIISALCQAGIPVLNGKDGRGYYLSTDPLEVLQMAETEYNRAMSILRRVSGYKSYALDLHRAGQTELEMRP